MNCAECHHKPYCFMAFTKMSDGCRNFKQKELTRKERFAEIRKTVAREIGRRLAEDGHCKPYEGTWEITTGYPNFFDDPAATAGAESYCITLHGYLIGPGRHYDWRGETLEECIDKCERDIREWIEGDEG